MQIEHTKLIILHFISYCLGITQLRMLKRRVQDTKTRLQSYMVIIRIVKNDENSLTTITASKRAVKHVNVSTTLVRGIPSVQK